MFLYDTEISVANLPYTSSVEAVPRDTLIQNPEATDTFKTVSLEEIVVKANLVNREGRKDIYTVTKTMREESRNAGELMGKIPGVFYNPLSTEIIFRGSQNIIILVDGVEKDDQYIKRLRPDRFAKIEITTMPVGLYAGYDAVINLHTKSAYSGYEGLGLMEAAVSTGGRNGYGKVLRNSREAAQFTYTRDRLNLDFVAGHAFGQQGMSDYYSIQYPLNGLTETTKEASYRQPNKTTKTNRFQGDFSLDYDINAKHSVSAKVSATPSTLDEKHNSDIKRDFTDKGYTEIVHETKNLDEKNRLDILAGVWYRGEISDWRINANATYTHIGFDRNRNIIRSSGYEMHDNRKIRSNYFSGGVALDRYFNNHKWQLSLTDNIIYTRYREFREATGASLSESNDFRNTLSASVLYNGNNHLSWSANVGVSIFRNFWEGTSVTHTTPKAGIMAMWTPSSKAMVRLNYSLSTSYPTLSSLQYYGQFTDSLIYTVGNPRLKTTLNHEAIASATFFNTLTIEGRINHSANTVFGFYSTCEGLTPSGVNTYYTQSSFVNGTRTGWNVNVTFGKAFGNHWQVSLSASVKGYSAKYEKWKSSRVLPEYSWYIVYQLLNGSLQFYLSGSMDSHMTITPQIDLWERTEVNALAVSKTFFKDKLQLIGMWMIPFTFTNGKAHGGVSSESYQTRYWADNQSRIYNMLRFTAIYKFNGGASVKKYSRQNKTVEL